MALNRLCSVVIVDNDELTRLALTLLINGQQGFRVAHACCHLKEALGLPPEAEDPIYLFDIAQLAAEERPLLLPPNAPLRGRLLAYSSHAYDGQIEAALSLGICGYLLKSAPLREVICALKELAQGGRYFAPAVTARLLAAPSLGQPCTRRSLVSKREWEILALVAQGFKAKEIGRHLHISAKTVDRHKANLMAKLAVSSQEELTCYALADGLIKA